MMNTLKWRWTLNAKELLIRARNEVADENLKKAIELLKVKLRSRSAAQTVVDNIDREIKDLELRIEQGNI